MYESCQTLDFVDYLKMTVNISVISSLLIEGNDMIQFIQPYQKGLYTTYPGST